MRRGWCVPVGALALLGGSVLAASTAAGASAATGHPAGHRVAVVRPGGLVKAMSGFGTRHATSANWSGYALHNGTYRSVSANWVESKAHCKAGDGHDYASFWVGLDGYGSNSVEQTGTDADCQGATPRYYAWYEMYPAPSKRISHTVRPGDHMSATTVYNGGGSFTNRLTDHTRHWTATEHRKLASAKRASAEVIVEAPSSLSGELPLANFGTVHFTGSKVNGTKIGGHHPTKITMVVSGRQLDRVSALSHGTNFSATFLRR